MQKQKAILKIKSFSHKDGELLLYTDDYSVRAMLKGITELCTDKYGGFIRLEMSAPYKARSLEQNSKYWAMCTEYGNYCGMTREDVSMGVKYRAMEEGLWRGKEIPFSKNGEKIPDSTVTADTQEMAILIEVLYRIAAEDGYEFKD